MRVPSLLFFLINRLIHHVLAGSWAANCAATDGTNGVDFKNSGAMAKISAQRAQKLAKASIIQDAAPKSAVGLPSQFQPSLPTVNGSEGVIKSYILPDKKTGVVRPLFFERAVERDLRYGVDVCGLVRAGRLRPVPDGCARHFHTVRGGRSHSAHR